MSATPLRAPRTFVTRRARHLGFPESAISVALSDKAASLTEWRIRVDVVTSGGQARLGEVLTARLAGKRIASRVVLIASCPGALYWQVRATPWAATGPVGGYIRVETCEAPGSLGVVPCDGSLLLAGGPEAGDYNHDAGAIAGITTVPAGARVDGWSVLAGVGAATVLITTRSGPKPLVTVPAGASQSDAPRNLIGPATLDFGGSVASRFVSWGELS